MSTNTQRVRLVVEYDVEIFDEDPEDMYAICEYELEHIENWGFDATIPDFDKIRVTIVPILGVGS